MRGSGSVGEFSVWELFTFFYCPREFYLYRKLGLAPKPMKKMEIAKEEHEKEKRRSGRRETIYGLPKEDVAEILRDVAVEDPELGLYGKIDTVLKLKNGELIPVEVKYSSLPFVSRAWRKQMLAYITLLERTSGSRVNRGILYLLPLKRVFWINAEVGEKRELKRDMERMYQVACSDSIPRAIEKERCNYCEMLKYCRRI